MRWEDERYVRVYTRDTGDWLALSFAAQAVFLMLLRKVDRIGELHLGKRGRAAIPACIGHGGAPISDAIDELLRDGCVRLRDDEQVLFIPNFLRAQETPKSPTERKREQRERDAAQALEKTAMSRDVTPVTNGHEMSPRAVPSRAVPNHAEPPEPEKPMSADPPTGVSADPVAAMGGLSVPTVALGARPERRAADSPLREIPPVAEEGDDELIPAPAAAVFEHWRAVMGKNASAKFKGKRKRNVLARLKDGYSADDLKAAVDGCAVTPHNMGQNAQGVRYDDLELICRDATQVERFIGNAAKPPVPRANGDPHKSPIRAENIPLALHERTGTVDNF